MKAFDSVLSYLVCRLFVVIPVEGAIRMVCNNRKAFPDGLVCKVEALEFLIHHLVQHIEFLVQRYRSVPGP